MYYYKKCSGLKFEYLVNEGVFIKGVMLKLTDESREIVNNI